MKATIRWVVVVYLISDRRVRTVMGNLEKSCNLKMVISRPGKVLENKKSPKFLEKS